VRRSGKAEGLIGSKSGSIHISFGVSQKIDKEDECRDIEKREASVNPKFQSPVEWVVLAMGRIERRTNDLRRDVRRGRRPVRINMGDIEGRHRNEKLLK
jgi:hypothetical protein